MTNGVEIYTVAGVQQHKNKIWKLDFTSQEKHLKINIKCIQRDDDHRNNPSWERQSVTNL